jgi:probable F420-dependent oxidoreductase
VAVPASHAEAMGATWYEPASTLGFFAAATARVRLLAHVLVLPYRHPLVAAKMFATLDRLSNGRVIIGTGSGHLKPEFRSLGIDHAARGAMSDEYLRALSVALEQDSSSFDGQFVSWRDMMVAPRPVQKPRPPLWVGGNAPALARRAGHLADGWIPWQLEPEEFARGARIARDARAASGRTGPFALVAPMRIARPDSAAEIAARVRAWTDVGATAFHLGFESASAADFIERMEFFQADVVAPGLSA